MDVGHGTTYKSHWHPTHAHRELGPGFDKQNLLGENQESCNYRSEDTAALTKAAGVSQRVETAGDCILLTTVYTDVGCGYGMCVCVCVYRYVCDYITVILYCIHDASILYNLKCHMFAYVLKTRGASLVVKQKGTG